MKVILTICLLLLTRLCFAQLKEISNLTPLEIEAFKIKKISLFYNDKLQETDLFDTLGNCYESNYFFSFYKKRLRQYNKYGKLVEEKEYGYGDTIMDRHVYQYNNRQQQITSSLYNDEWDLVYSDSTWYTKAGKEQEYTRYNRKGIIKYGFIYKYDTTGRMISKKEYNKLRQLEFRTVFKYNRMGKLVEEITYDDKGAVDVKWETIYDTKWREIKSICKGNCDIGGGWIKKYDLSGNVVRYTELNEDGSVSFIYNNSFDKLRNKTAVQVTNFEGEVLETPKMTYNEDGLLIRKIKNGTQDYRIEYEFY